MASSKKYDDEKQSKKIKEIQQFYGRGEDNA